MSKILDTFTSLFAPASKDLYNPLPDHAQQLPLLEQGNGSREEQEQQEDSELYFANPPPPRRPIYLWWIAILCASVLGFAVATFIWYNPQELSSKPTTPNHPIPPPPPERPAPPTPPSPPTPPAETKPERPDTDDATQRAQNLVDELFARQSKTLEEATTLYTLKNNRPPPPGYDKFFKYAKDNHCLIDEYDRVHRDFEPFYQIQENHPTFFKDMIKRSMKMGEDNESIRLTTYKLRQAGPVRTHNYYSPFPWDWEAALRIVAEDLPPMDVVFNYQDEPRVLFNTRLPDAKEHATDVIDARPFDQKPVPTDKFFSESGTRHQCLIPNSPVGFGNLTNDVNGFMLYSSSTGFTTDLYPMLSQTKIEPCFADILIPSSYYYYRSAWSSKYGHEDGIPWDKKTSKIYWRGSTTGGSYHGDLWKSFPRFRFIEMAKHHTDIMDGQFTSMKNCGTECPEDEVKKVYGIGRTMPKENEYNFKYLFDVDGNTFSGRYLGMMRGNSLVFKSTVFTEFFEDWLRPYEHYIPVLPDLSDLEAKVRWAIDNDEEAYRIQRAGREMVRRVMTDAQNDCYYYAVFLEYARLQQSK